MLTYKAMYKFLDEGVHGQVLDFPGAISFAENLEKVRRSLASALGEPLPLPNPQITDKTADLEEPIYLILTRCKAIEQPYFNRGI